MCNTSESVSLLSHVFFCTIKLLLLDQVLAFGSWFSLCCVIASVRRSMALPCSLYHPVRALSLPVHDAARQSLAVCIILSVLCHCQCMTQHGTPLQFASSCLCSIIASVWRSTALPCSLYNPVCALSLPVHDAAWQSLAVCIILSVVCHCQCMTQHGTSLQFVSSCLCSVIASVWHVGCRQRQKQRRAQRHTHRHNGLHRASVLQRHGVPSDVGRVWVGE